MIEAEDGTTRIDLEIDEYVAGLKERISLTPDDCYEEYSEWLYSQRDLHICNGDDLIRHFESGTRFGEFLAQREEV